ncbi:hypothetical protein FRB99_001166 [Tulasnella sp. 403]|nr:hypothetical protein FRB99_001166 [Tulasnella sp. 403]
MASLRPAYTYRALVGARRNLTRTYASQFPLKESDFKLSQVPQLNAYPDIPIIYQLREAKGWDDVQERRNINEPVPEQFEAVAMMTPDPPHVPKESALRQFAVAAIVFTGVAYALNLITPERVSTPRDYPHDGLVKELGGLEENKALPESIDEE